MYHLEIMQICILATVDVHVATLYACESDCVKSCFHNTRVNCEIHYSLVIRIHYYGNYNK